MSPQDLPDFVTILTGLAAIKPGGKLSKEALMVWELAMAEWSIDAFRAAASHLARTVEFMPSPFHFEQLRKAANPTSGEAWLKARQAIRNATWSQIESSGFSCGDALIDRAVHAIGGYRVIGMCDTDKLHFLERRFAEHLEDMGNANEVREAVPQIAAEARKRISGPQRAVLSIEVET